MKTVKLTEPEFLVLYYALRSQVNWGAAGCFGDGQMVTSKRDFKVAQKILGKLKVELPNKITI